MNLFFLVVSLFFGIVLPEGPWKLAALASTLLWIAIIALKKPDK